MSNISKLIQELCPDGVEFVEISSIAVRNKGISITAAKMKKMIVTNGPIRLFAAGQNFIDTSDKYVDMSKIIDTPSIIVKSRGHIGFEYYDKPFQHKSEMWSYEIISDAVNIKFLYYYLLSKSRYFQDLARATSVKLPQLSVKDTDNFRIPVPPLGVQEEIIRILDRFTLLEAELEAELEARKKQYAFYRDSLLNFENVRGGVADVCILQDVVKIKNGRDYKHLSAGQIPVYGSGGIMLHVSESIYEKASVLIPRKGSLGNLFYVDSPFWVVDTIFYTLINIEKILPRYLYHYLLTADLASLNTAGGVPSLTQTVLNKVKIPVPPIEGQQRIVDILDRFDALINDISSGLPAEIAARRKQYEHYRDQLLTFKELEPAAGS